MLTLGHVHYFATSPNPLEKLLREARVLPYFTEEETEAQFLGSHSYQVAALRFELGQSDTKCQMLSC